MSVSNKPKDDAQAMYELYIKGVPINDIADKFNHTSRDVEDIVTTMKPVKKDK